MAARADEESSVHLSPKRTPRPTGHKVLGRPGDQPVRRRLPRRRCGQGAVHRRVSPKQMNSASRRGLIPFLEHDDANPRSSWGRTCSGRRCRCSSPSRRSWPPGWKWMSPATPACSSRADPGRLRPLRRFRALAFTSLWARASTRTAARGSRRPGPRAEGLIREYVCRKFTGLNERTCLNQKPIIKLGDKVKKDQIIADEGRHAAGRAGSRPERARRVHVMGRPTTRRRHHHQRTAREGRCVHLDPHRGVRPRNSRDEARQGRVQARHSERVAEGLCSNLDDNGIVRIGTFVIAGRRPRRQGVAEVEERCSRRKRSCCTRSSAGPART